MLLRAFVRAAVILSLARVSCTSERNPGLPLSEAGSGLSSVTVQEHAHRQSVAIELRDGSRIVCTPLAPAFTLESSFGPVEIAFDSISSIVFADSTRSVQVELQNGDRLRGLLRAEAVPVQYAAGKLSIPVSAIVRISCESSPGDLSAGLIAHYPLRGATSDATGHGHDAVNYGASPAPDRFGVQGRAYGFGGTDAHMRLPEGLIDPGTPACTISLWVLTRSSLQSRQALYIGAATGELSLWNENSRFYFGPGLTDRVQHNVSAPAKENVFVHLAGVYVRGTSVRLYVNGTRASEISPPDFPLQSGLPEYSSGIGAYAPEHPEHGRRFGRLNWYGSICDVRIYNRELSDDEIMSLARGPD